MHSISIIIPIYNELENILILYNDICKVFKKLPSRRYEIIFINDGSHDGSTDVLRQLASSDSNIKLINFRKNFGQTAAMSAGIEYANGDIIIPMDADNQNDPQDIPRLILKLEEGFDVVSGWRKYRKDKSFSRILPSKIANWCISKISGVKLHDYGCSLKAYRREIIKGVKLYGEMHRFIPIYAFWQGGKIAELPVNHHPRKFGKSKYGIGRTFSVISDLLLIKFFEKFATKPIHLIGGFGLINFLLGFITFVTMIYYKFWGGKTFVETPLPQLVVMFFMIGILAIFMGFISEILMRTYYESQSKQTYLIGEIINHQTEDDLRKEPIH